MKYKSIFFCTAHPTKDMGNVKEYFIKNSQYFLAFHFFLGFSSSPTYIEKYKQGKLVLKREFDYYHGKNKLLQNLLNFLYFSYTLLFHLPRNSYLLINAPIYCFLNSFFTFLKGHTYVLWIGDYYPNNKFPMNLYHKFVEFYDKHLKYVIYVSPAVAEVYAKKDNQQNKFRKTISLGIKREIVTQHKKINTPVKLGFIGIIRSQQGLDLCFEYLRTTDTCTLEIIGDGYYLQHYKNLATALGLKDKVVFYGRVDNIDPYISKWDVGMALYEGKSDNLSIYCEPTKIKNYLSFGLPVITTGVTYFSKEIEENNAGCVIKESPDSLDKALNNITAHYTKYVRGARALANKYEYNSWYDKHFSFLA